MNKKDVFRELGSIDESYIHEADISDKSAFQNPRLKWASIAACFLLAVVGVAALWGGLLTPKNDFMTLENGDTINFVKSDMVGSKFSLDMAVTTRTLTNEEAQKLLPGLPLSASAVYSDKDNTLLGIEGKIGDVKMIIATADVPLLDTVIAGTESSTEVDGVFVTAGYFITKPNSKGEQNSIYYASFKLGNSSVYVENAGLKQDREATKNELASIVQKLIAGGELDTEKLLKEAGV